MENIKETLWYQNFDWSMIWVCIGAVLVLLLYMEVYGQKEVIIGKYGDAIRKRKWLKRVYHLASGLLMLTFVSEIGYGAIKPFINLSIEAEGNLLHFLAAISGLGGGYIIAKIIRLVQKLIA